MDESLGFADPYPPCPIKATPVLEERRDVPAQTRSEQKVPSVRVRKVGSNVPANKPRSFFRRK
jgi:hypothetical protein